MKKTLFKITKMDCPSEEQLIRMTLGHFSEIKNLEFDIPNRHLYVYHSDKIDSIEEALAGLKLGSQKIKTEESTQTKFEEQSNQRKLLWIVLLINFAFFLLEITTGFLSNSMGLVADSLDMLSDSFVYGISLFAVGGTMLRKKMVAKTAGYFQILLAAVGFTEVLRRFFGTADIPDPSTMIIISVFALIANAICLYLLRKSKSKEEAHIKASLIFTSNDVIINLGVISAGFLVHWLHSNKPDLIIGSIVFLLVLQGAFRILRISK